jgi:hypothetical protein
MTWQLLGAGEPRIAAPHRSTDQPPSAPTSVARAGHRRLRRARHPRERHRDAAAVASLEARASPTRSVSSPGANHALQRHGAELTTPPPRRRRTKRSSPGSAARLRRADANVRSRRDGIFLSRSRVLPAEYPLRDGVSGSTTSVEIGSSGAR